MSQNLAVKINTIRQKVRAFEMKEVELNTNLKNAQQRLEEAEAECRAQGVEPEQLDETIVSLEKRMEVLAKSVEDLLPDSVASIPNADPF